MNKQQRQTMAKEAFQMVKVILASDHTRSINLADTPYGYIGTDNMTDEQLMVHHATLLKNVQMLREEM